MYIVGVLALDEQYVEEIEEVEYGLNQRGYAVHLEQMAFNMQSPQVGDMYEKEAVILWLCRCFGDALHGRKAVEGFLQADVDAILALNEAALKLTLDTAQDSPIPIVFTHVNYEPGIQSEIESLRSSGRVSGVWDNWVELAEERLTLATEFVPPPTAFHLLYNPNLPAVQAEMNAMVAASKNLKIKLIPYEVHSRSEATQVLENMHPHKDHALLRMADPTMERFGRLMGVVAREQDIPYIGLSIRGLERNGALFALEATNAGREAARLIDLILHGESLANIPTCTPPDKTLGINLQAAQELGLVVSPAALKQAQIVLPAVEGVQLRTRFFLLLVFSILMLSLVVLAASQLEFTYMLAITLFTTLASIFGMWIFLNRSILEPIRQLSRAAEKIGTGDLNVNISQVKGEEDVNKLAQALRRMRRNLKASYVELEQLNLNLEQQVVELTEAYRTLQKTQQELELASRRIIDAEDCERFALTTYIHDEILRPLEDLSQLAQDYGKNDLIRLSAEVERRIRQVRFDLSSPILQDLSLELKRLTIETVPMMFASEHKIDVDVDLAALDKLPTLEPAYTFMLYRFVNGAVVNCYRHSQAKRVEISARADNGMLTMRVADDGQGFDPGRLEEFVKCGHFFYHDISIRARQLDGYFSVDSTPGKGSVLEVGLPMNQKGKSAQKGLKSSGNHKAQKSYPRLMNA